MLQRSDASGESEVEPTSCLLKRHVIKKLLDKLSPSLSIIENASDQTLMNGLRLAFIFMRIIVACLEQLLSSAKLMHDPITLMPSLHNVLVSLMLERPIVLCLTSDHNTYSHESTSNRKDTSVWHHNHFLICLASRQAYIMRLILCK